MFSHMNSVVFGEVSFEVNILIENNNKRLYQGFEELKRQKQGDELGKTKLVQREPAHSYNRI